MPWLPAKPGVEPEPEETSMRRVSPCLALALLLALPGAASAACPDDAAVAAYVADVAAARVSRGFGDIGLEDATCAKAKVAARLPAVLGRKVGYKAAFTNPAVQKRFGVSGPAWGTMYEDLMIPSGSSLPARFGARPFQEADFVAIVKDAGLAKARTPLEALAHISAVVPFIELPDLMVEGDVGGAGLIAVNVGFRGGVLGPRVPAEATQAFADALANMTVVMTEERSGKELGRARGSALMDHPLNAAIWIAQALEREGIALRPGDLLSLGGYVPPTPAQPGTIITVRYVGLPGDPSVSVTFE
jgi:2-oxo-hept-3-ene-1,7-dioate hydratase